MVPLRSATGSGSGRAAGSGRCPSLIQPGTGGASGFSPLSNLGTWRSQLSPVNTTGKRRRQRHFPCPRCRAWAGARSQRSAPGEPGQPGGAPACTAEAKERLLTSFIPPGDGGSESPPCPAVTSRQGTRTPAAPPAVGADPSLMDGWMGCHGLV